MNKIKIFIASVLLILPNAGCATSGYEDKSISELKKLCEMIVPCEPCPTIPTLPPPVVTPPVVLPPITPPPQGSEDLDMTAVLWDEPAGNIGEWPVTAAITGVRWGGTGYSVGSIHGTFAWPLQPGAENTKETIGNWWLLAKCEDGKWHGATMEWLGRGKMGFSGKKWDGNDDTRGCLANWKPNKRGEVIYGMISTCARSGIQNGRERSDPMKITIQ